MQNNFEIESAASADPKDRRGTAGTPAVPLQLLHKTKRRRKTGPKTRKGRAAVGRNAIKHGIMVPHPGIIEGMESEEEYDRHVGGIVANLAPEGALEEELAERIASLLWRLRRVTRYESAAINYHVHSTRSDLRTADLYLAPNKDQVPEPDARLVAVHQERRVIPPDADIDKIIRYETHLHRQVVQTQHELEALQARRRGEPTHLARLDISSPPAGYVVATRGPTLLR